MEAAGTEGLDRGEGLLWVLRRLQSKDKRGQFYLKMKKLQIEI